jgi:hypothetical protein
MKFLEYLRLIFYQINPRKFAKIIDEGYIIIILTKQTRGRT